MRRLFDGKRPWGTTPIGQFLLLASLSVVSSAGCGLLLDVDPSANRDGEVGVTDTSIGDAMADARADTATPFDGGPDAIAPADAAPDAVVSRCVPSIVDQLELQQVAGRGFVDLQENAGELMVLHRTDSAATADAFARVELESFSEPYPGIAGSNSASLGAGPSRLAVAGGRYHAFTAQGEGLTHWSFQWGTTGARWPVNGASDVFAVASEPLGAFMISASGSEVSAWRYLGDGSGARIGPWLIPNAAAIEDMDVAWVDDRGLAGTFVAVVGENESVVPGGRVMVYEFGPYGRVISPGVDLLATIRDPNSFYSRPDSERSLWIAGTRDVIAVAYAVGSNPASRGFSADMALLRRGSMVPEHTLVPLAEGKQMLAMTIGDGFDAVVYAATNDAGTVQLYFHPLGGAGLIDGPALGDERLALAAVPDPGPTGFALVAFKAYDGGVITLLRLGCAP